MPLPGAGAPPGVVDTAASRRRCRKDKIVRTSRASSSVTVRKPTLGTCAGRLRKYEKVPEMSRATPRCSFLSFSVVRVFQASLGVLPPWIPRASLTSVDPSEVRPVRSRSFWATLFAASKTA